MSRSDAYTLIDKKLLMQFQENPEKAFKAMFDTYNKQLSVYAMQLTDSFELAEEAVQRMFIYFWEKKCWKNVEAHLRNYLFQSTKNMALAILKEYKLRSMEDISELPVDIPEEPLDDDEWKKKEQALLEDLEKLPAQEVLAVKLVVMQDRKYREAAEEMNMSVNTLKTHLSRALSKLRAKHNLMLLF